MPQYLSPGVYVEEINAGPKPIEGVSTSVCGAVGMTLVVLPLRGVWPVGVVAGLAAYAACFYAVESRVAPGDFAFVTGAVRRRFAGR